jgi:hypothetical protein
MALATYSDLQASIAAWLHRDDLTAIIPDWIALAEKRINGDLDARLQDTVSTLSTVAATATVAAPTDVVNIRSLTVQASPNRVLDYLTPDQFNTQYAFAETGMPRMFTVIGANIYLGPTPDAVYSVQCIYKAQVPALSVASPTNWLLTNYPQVYLFASLCMSVMYTADESSLPNWETRYAEAVSSVSKMDWYSGSTMRVRSDVRL